MLRDDSLKQERHHDYLQLSNHLTKFASDITQKKIVCAAEDFPWTNPKTFPGSITEQARILYLKALELNPHNIEAISALAYAIGNGSMSIILPHETIFFSLTPPTINRYLQSAILARRALELDPKNNLANNTLCTLVALRMVEIQPSDFNPGPPPQHQTAATLCTQKMLQVPSLPLKNLLAFLITTGEINEPIEKAIILCREILAQKQTPCPQAAYTLGLLAAHQSLAPLPSDFQDQNRPDHLHDQIIKLFCEGGRGLFHGLSLINVGLLICASRPASAAKLFRKNLKMDPKNPYASIYLAALIANTTIEAQANDYPFPYYQTGIKTKDVIALVQLALQEKNLNRYHPNTFLVPIKFTDFEKGNDEQILTALQNLSASMKEFAQSLQNKPENTAADPVPAKKNTPEIEQLKEFIDLMRPLVSVEKQTPENVTTSAAETGKETSANTQDATVTNLKRARAEDEEKNDEKKKKEKSESLASNPAALFTVETPLRNIEKASPIENTLQHQGGGKEGL